MFSGVRVILGHVLSTAGKPKHEDCPKGSTSQSSYQRDIANRIQEHWLIKNSLTPAIVEKVEPVFETFGDKQFLAAVEKCYTTNANFIMLYGVSAQKNNITLPRDFQLLWIC